jgi:hypothetical protein
MTRNLEDKITLPSGAERSKFDTSIPGQSWTKTPDMYPWDKPPRLNTPDEVMDYFIDKFSDEQVAKQLIGLLSMDISVATVVDSMLLTGFAEGLFTPDVAILTTEDLSMLVMHLADKSGVKYKPVDDENEIDVQDAFHKLAQMKGAKEMGETTKEDAIMPEQPIEMVKEAPAQGIMAKQEAI